jgi:hypothetical protein
MLQPLYNGPYTVLRRSLHYFTQQIGNKTDKVSTLRLKAFSNHTAPPALPQPPGRLPGVCFWDFFPGQHAGCTSPSPAPRTLGGKRFPLAGRQGVLHVPLLSLPQRQSGQHTAAGPRTDWIFETSSPPVLRSGGSTVEDLPLLPRQQCGVSPIPTSPFMYNAL